MTAAVMMPVASQATQCTMLPTPCFQRGEGEYLMLAGQFPCGLLLSQLQNQAIKLDQQETVTLEEQIALIGSCLKRAHFPIGFGTNSRREAFR